MSLILFVLVLLAYVHDLVSAKKLAALGRQIDASEVKLQALRAEIEAGRADLEASRARVRDQQVVLADNGRQLDALRAQLQSIAVLRVSVLNKLKQALQAELGPTTDGGGELVTIGDSGDVLINESLVFEYGSYAVKKDARPVLDTLARVLGNVLADPSVRENVDTILIQGHTDERGSAQFNWDLSAKRATVVLNYLFEANPVLADSYGSYFSASAYSKFRPVDPGKTEASYQRNRRIEIAVIPKDENVRKVIDDYVHGAGAAP
jgi:chemotaxis protein MotB